MRHLYFFLSHYKNIISNIVKNLLLCSSKCNTVIYVFHKGVNASAAAESIQSRRGRSNGGKDLQGGGWYFRFKDGS